VVLSGVLGSTSSTGEIKVSALKQYGFLDGPSTGYVATDLSKKIASAPDEEILPLLRQATLTPPVFKGLFDTFHGDEVSKARIKQRACELKVHPDLSDKCTEIYISAICFSKLGSLDGDKITHISSSEISGGDKVSEDSISTNLEDGEDLNSELKVEVPPRSEIAVSAERGGGAVFHVNVTLDSSLDIEKLQRQLEILKRYGAI
jgi:hypothetical protein